MLQIHWQSEARFFGVHSPLQRQPLSQPKSSSYQPWFPSGAKQVSSIHTMRIQSGPSGPPDAKCRVHTRKPGRTWLSRFPSCTQTGCPNRQMRVKLFRGPPKCHNTFRVWILSLGASKKESIKKRQTRQMPSGQGKKRHPFPVDWLCRGTLPKKMLEKKGTGTQRGQFLAPKEEPVFLRPLPATYR